MNAASKQFLQVLPHLKYPGFEFSGLAVTQVGKTLASILNMKDGKHEPSSLRSHLDARDAASYVSLKIEAIFATAIGILYANEDMKPNNPIMWQKVQRILEQRDVT
nr:uncharacterized protein CTRU02_03614 [Colletotrichum truncatum]KAF6796636.1 hypothetical protein CTRU02_03614 [Colletotrichum truncatum]